MKYRCFIVTHWDLTWIGVIVRVEETLVVPVNGPRHAWPHRLDTQCPLYIVANQFFPLD